MKGFLAIILSKLLTLPLNTSVQINNWSWYDAYPKFSDGSGARKEATG